MSKPEDKIEALKKPVGRAVAKIAFAIIGAFAIAITTTQYRFGLDEKKAYFNALDIAYGSYTETRIAFARAQDMCLCYLKAKENGKVSDEITRAFFILYRSRVNEVLDALKNTFKKPAIGERIFGPSAVREQINFFSTLSMYYFVDEMRCDKNLPDEQALKLIQVRIENAAIDYGRTALHYTSKLHSVQPESNVATRAEQTDTRRHLDACRYDLTLSYHNTPLRTK